MADSSLLPVREGDLLAGKYRVERVLGVGGMGIVVAARHEQLDQRVAIKFVRDEALGNEEAVARFLREARSAVKLKSEHAAKVLDVGTLESGAPYMVMEYLEGSDLAAVLLERGPLPIEEASDYVVQACEAVAEAHAAGIVHRDIKPQNLFLARTVGDSARVKVLDFGVAKSLVASGGAGALTQTRSMLGSPLYMSPEQMRSSRDVDARSDVWALGVVLFELLTKRWPYEAETMPELCLKVVTDPPLPLGELRPDVPPEMVKIVERCLEKDPGKRFANAAELASALEPWVPVASRITVERARLAIGATTGRGALASAPTIIAPESGARTAPTPAAWGSGRVKTQLSEQRGRSPAVWIGVGFAGAAAIGVAVLLFRSPAPAPAASPPPPVAAVLAPLPTAQTAVAPGAGAGGATAAAAPSATPSETASSQSAATASASGTATAKPLVPSARISGGAGGAGGAGAGAVPAKPKPKDDDIPSLR